MEKEKHSGEVQQLRGKLLCDIETIDFETLSTADRYYIYGLVVHSEAHLRDTAGGDFV